LSSWAAIQVLKEVLPRKLYWLVHSLTTTLTFLLKIRLLLCKHLHHAVAQLNEDKNQAFQVPVLEKASDMHYSPAVFSNVTALNNKGQILCFCTLSIVLFLPKTPSCLYFKIQSFGDWIMYPSSGKTYSFGPNR
jgi:hypothetical protein